MQIQLYIIGILISISLIFVAFISLLEKEKTAMLRSILFSVIFPIPFFMIAYLNISILNTITFAVFIVALIILFFPSINLFNKKYNWELPSTQIDERDIMFSRNKLERNSTEFNNYYKVHPEYFKNDETFRKNPGLCGINSIYYNQFLYEATNANFHFTELLKPNSKFNSSNQSVDIDPKQVTDFLQKWIIKKGAVDVGFGKLHPYHLYSHHGYKPNYGKQVELQHKNTIAFLVEMDSEMMSYSPQAPAILESSEQYLDSAIIAVTVAKFIQNLGYSAYAHTDGNYDLVAPLVARDCGLGEIGRMGLLISKKYGPRVRIAVVTTDLPIIPTLLKPDSSVEKFCSICKKCADLCPSQAIPFDDKQNIDGTKRWQIDQEKCFHLWTKFGTDCGRCMQVCPYSHPNNFFHNFIRFSIKHFPVFRRIAAKMDDLFYGKFPKIKKLPNWIGI